MTNTVGIFHGYGGNKPTSWLSWLNNQLTQKGITTIYPSFPFLGTSNIEAWYDELSQYKNSLKEPISLVGHSAGTIFCFYAVQKLDLKFEKLILVSPLNDINGVDTSSIFKEPGREDQVPFVRSFVHQQFDYNLIKSKVKEFVFIFSDNDPHIPYPETMDYYKKIFPSAKFITLHNQGHINEKAGITELPIVLKELL